MTNMEKRQWLLDQLFTNGESEPPKPIILTLNGNDIFEWPDPEKYRLDFGSSFFPPTFYADEMRYMLIPRWRSSGLCWQVEDVTG